MDTALTAAGCLERVAELRAEEAALKPIFSDNTLALKDYAKWHAAFSRSLAISTEINALLNRAADLIVGTVQ